MTTDSSDGSTLLAQAWAIQEVLQKVGVDDFSQRCSDRIDETNLPSPMAIVAVAVDMMIDEIEVKDAVIAEREKALITKIEIISKQAKAIKELSTPVIEVWKGVLALPVVGALTDERSDLIMQTLLERITELEVSSAIIDVTGVEFIDTRVANSLINIVRAARLLGVHCMVTGLQPPVAQTLVELGVDLSALETYATLRQGLAHCLKSRSS